MPHSISFQVPIPDLFILYIYNVAMCLSLHDADTYREKGGVWSSDPTHVPTHQATAVTG